MKILVINQSFAHLSGEFGGKVGNKRNTDILRTIFGSENMVVYTISEYKNKLYTLFYFLFGYASGVTPKIIRELKTVLSTDRFDSIFINTSCFGTIAKQLRGCNVPVITFFHNIEINFYNAFYQNASILRKLWYHVVFKHTVSKAEQNAVLYSKKIMALNKRDAEALKRIYNRLPNFILPITFYDTYNTETARQYETPQIKKKLLYVGADFPMNTEGLFWFIENCLDAINAELLVVGTGMDKYKSKYQQKEVSFIGYVEDLAGYYYQADAVVLPILSGSGMKTKTCEALMYGKTVFGTTEAFQGYDALDYTAGHWLCDTVEDFIMHINTYLAEYNDKTNHYSREIFIKHYSTAVYESRLREFFLQVTE